MVRKAKGEGEGADGSLEVEDGCDGGIRLRSEARREVVRACSCERAWWSLRVSRSWARRERMEDGVGVGVEEFGSVVVVFGRGRFCGGAAQR